MSGPYPASAQPQSAGVWPSTNPVSALQKQRISSEMSAERVKPKPHMVERVEKAPNTAQVPSVAVKVQDLNKPEILLSGQTNEGYYP